MSSYTVIPPFRCCTARMSCPYTPGMAIELADGGDITSGDLRTNHADVAYFVNAGNMTFVTISGKRRYAIVPVEAGEEFLARRTLRPEPGATAPAAASEDAESVHQNAHSTPNGPSGDSNGE